MNDSAATIRRATASEAATLAAFGARTFREAFAADNTAEDMRRHLESAWHPDRQRAELADPGMDTLVSVDANGGWQAFAQLRAGTVSDGVPAEGAIELWRFYVDKPWQGSGVATRLMEAAKRCARERGARWLWLGVWERNTRAQAFYTRQGFRPVGRQVFTVGSDPQTDHVMLAPLA